MLQKAEVSSRVRKGIQGQTVSSNLSEPKNRHIARNSGDEVPTQMTVTASVRAITGSSSWKTGCSEERPFYAVLELTTEMRKPTLDAEKGLSEVCQGQFVEGISSSLWMPNSLLMAAWCHSVWEVLPEIDLQLFSLLRELHKSNSWSCSKSIRWTDLLSVPVTCDQ